MRGIPRKPRSFGSFLPENTSFRVGWSRSRNESGAPLLLDEQSATCLEVRPHKDKRGVDLISDALPFGEACGTRDRDTVKCYSRSHGLFRNGSPSVRASAYPSTLKPRLGHSAILPPSLVREMRVPGSACSP